MPLSKLPDDGWRIPRFFIVIWILAALTTLGLLGVIVWAIVVLVSHYT